uniref:DsbA family protein n=1 Tax=Microvirga soli TaxID=1854496 RepID=UPI00191E74E8
RERFIVRPCEGPDSNSTWRKISVAGQAQSIIDLANSPEIRERYDQETDAARQLGIFGSPTFAVGQEIFWGDDRLEEALAWAAGKHPALR